MAQYKTKKENKTSKVSSRVKKQKVTKLSTKQKTSIAVEDTKFNAVVLPVNDELSIVEKAKLIEKDGCPVNGNEFSKMRYDIASKIVDYDRIRKECKIHIEAQSKTIYRLAKPFLEGHFTLAVVGETSAGKSTFINTLIGDNLFPTGKDQTTSALTFIENGNEPKMEVLYCDGHTDPPYNDTDEIKKRLKQLVTIPEEYRCLPVNRINQLISENREIDEILSQKEDIELKTRTQRQKTDEGLWREYVNSHTKKDIPKAVIITYPLPNEFNGWQIIDTPGVGATGGIQEETQMLFNARDEDHNKRIDAIFYLQDGTRYMESAVDYDFLEMIVDGLTEDVKRRLFFVLTKAARDTSRGMEDFLDRKDKTLQKARELYADSFGISRERFYYIDSVLERFKNDVKDKKNFDIAPCPSNWDTEEWNDMTNLYTPIRKYLSVKGKRMINSSINGVMDEWSGFKYFKDQINQFIYAEKAKAYNEICSKIEEDYEGFIITFRKKIEILKGDSTTIKKERESLLNKKLELNEQLNNLQERTAIDFKKRYDFVDNEIKDFQKKGNISLIRTAYFELLDKLIEKENEIFNGLKQDFKQYWGKDDDLLGLLGLIDFDELEKRAEKEKENRTLDELEQQAEDDNTEIKYVKGKEVRKRKTFREFFRGLFKEGKWELYETTYPKSEPITEVNKEKKCSDFAEKIRQLALEKKDIFVSDTTNKAGFFKDLVGKEMECKISEAEKTLDELQQEMDSKENELSAFEENMVIIEETLKGVRYGK